MSNVIVERPAVHYKKHSSQTKHHVHHEHKHHHSHVASTQIFPLMNYFKQFKKEDGWDKGAKRLSKQFLMMSSNLAPALTVSEILNFVGNSLNQENIFHFIKPIGAIFTRQTIVDGINKKNAYKPIAASVSAVSLLAVQKAFKMPRFLLRPLLGAALFGIEEYGSLNQLLSKDKDKSKTKCNKKGCNHNHAHHSKHSHSHKPSWEKMLIGLGVLELQLMTVAPIIKKISDKLFHDSRDVAMSACKVLFDTIGLSTGFVGVGELLTKGLKRVSGDKGPVKSFVDRIEATVCPCCGTAGSCANAVTEDAVVTQQAW